MNGEQLLQALLKLTPEQRQLPVVAADHERWYYNVDSLDFAHINWGRKEDGKEPNSITLQ